MFRVLIYFVPLIRRWASSSFCNAVQLYFLFHQRSKLTLQKPLYFCFSITDIKKL